MKHLANKPLFSTDFQNNIPLELNKIYLVIHAAQQITSGEFRNHFIGKLIEFQRDSGVWHVIRLKFDVSTNFNSEYIFQFVDSILHIEELQSRSTLCTYCERRYEKETDYWKCPKYRKNNKFSFNCISECSDYQFLSQKQIEAINQMKESKVKR